MQGQSHTGDTRPDLMDFTPLGRLCGIKFDVRIAREIVDRASDETDHEPEQHEQ